MFGNFEENPQVFIQNGVKIELTEVPLAEDVTLKKIYEAMPPEKQAELLYLLSWRRPSGFRS